MKQLFAALVAFAIFAGVAQAQTKVTIGYGPGSAWAGAWIAQDRGIFKKNGLDVNFSFISGGQVQAAALIADSVQIVGNNPIQIFSPTRRAPIFSSSPELTGRARRTLIAASRSTPL